MRVKVTDAIVFNAIPALEAAGFMGLSMVEEEDGLYVDGVTADNAAAVHAVARGAFRAILLDNITDATDLVGVQGQARTAINEVMKLVWR